MTWLDFVVLALAASAIVDVWQNGSLFIEWRALFQALSDDMPGTDDGHIDVQAELVQPDPLPPIQRAISFHTPRWVGELLSCTFCFSYHTTWLVAVIWLLPKLVYPSVLTTIWAIPMYALAATRLGNICNSMLPPESRYNR